jgi:hypothetical protein
MDVEVSHPQLVGTDPIIITVREIAEEETQKKTPATLPQT